jgi:hypothetical protein
MGIAAVLGWFAAFFVLAKPGGSSQVLGEAERNRTGIHRLFRPSLSQRGLRRLWVTAGGETANGIGAAASGISGPEATRSRLLGRWFLNWGPNLLNWTKQSGQREEVSVVRQLTLTPTHRLHVLRVHGRELLVVTHPRGCETLNIEDKSGLPGDGRVQ